MAEKLNIAPETRRLVDALTTVRRRLRFKLVVGGLIRLATVVALALIGGVRWIGGFGCRVWSDSR